jgi:tetratricopeptide (TPR) repeat protein
MTVITITCQCGKKLKANPENAGMKGRCPDCGQVFTIPTPELGEDGEARMKRACQEAAALRSRWQEPGCLDQAEAAFRKAVEEFGHYWASHYGLANTLLFQFKQNRSQPDFEKRSEGLSELRKAMALDGTQREPLLELARRTAPSDMREAKRLYQKALRAPDASQQPLLPLEWQSVHYYKFAVAAAEAGLNALAIDAFTRALELDAEQCKANPPTLPKAKSCWSLALKKLGREEPA